MDLSIRYYFNAAKTLYNLGVDIPGILSDTGIKPEVFDSPNVNIPFSLLDELIERTAKHPTFRDEYCLAIGESYKVTTHDILGYAMLCSPNLDYVYKLTVKFAPFLMPAFRLKYVVQDEFVELEFFPIVPMSRTTWVIHMETMSSLLYWNLYELTQGVMPHHDIYYSMNTPKNTDQYTNMNFARFHFDSGSNVNLRMRYPKKHIFNSLPLADEYSLAMAEDRCRNRMLEVTEKGQLIPWVTMILTQTHDTVPNLQDLSTKLNISARTLDRRLKKENTSFRELWHKIRDQRSIKLLLDGVSVTEIAYTLGYSTPENFTRAFRKRHSFSPTEYIKQYNNDNQI
ncbi:hypothetical protein A9Q99_00315 [Gammaproteobacteria bacterium 45_16_T64]|nr:hypothetical protein A9Q99_00315 [Gammaproteobacteria bacterium 45_16_T64]